MNIPYPWALVVAGRIPIAGEDTFPEDSWSVRWSQVSWKLPRWCIQEVLLNRVRQDCNVQILVACIRSMSLAVGTLPAVAQYDHRTLIATEAAGWQIRFFAVGNCTSSIRLASVPW
jgi:hypothetical protein